MNHWIGDPAESDIPPACMRRQDASAAIIELVFGGIRKF